MATQDNYGWKCALITGGGSGIGRALAELFISKGKKVVVAGRTEAKVRKAAEELKCSYMVLDTSDIRAIKEFVRRLESEHPDVDCLVNNAGIMKTINVTVNGPSSIDVVLEDMEAELDTNIRGVLNLTLRLLPQIREKKGAVFNVSSGLAFVPKASNPVYNACKSFIHSWTWSLRAQVMADDVKVIEIIPPLVESELHRDDDDPEGYKNNPKNPALKMEDFIKEIAAELDAGKQECSAGFAKMAAQKYRDDYLGMYEGMNADLLKGCK